MEGFPVVFPLEPFLGLYKGTMKNRNDSQYIPSKLWIYQWGHYKKKSANSREYEVNLS
jgi:hypothetical protein